MTYSEQLGALKRLGEAQKEKRDYIEKAKKFYNKLAGDIKNNNLKKGLSERQVLSKYGSPVFCIVEGKIDAGRACLYRDPLKYFSTEKIYLYFDKDQKLSSWKVEPPSL